MNKIVTQFNINALKEYYKKTRINFLALSITFLVLLTGFIFITVFLGDWARIVGIIGLVISGALLAISLFISYSFIATLKAHKEINQRQEAVFNLDHIYIEIFENDTKKLEVKFNYNEIEKYSITKNYIVITLAKTKEVYFFNRDDKIISLFEEKKIARNKM